LLSGSGRLAKRRLDQVQFPSRRYSLNRHNDYSTRLRKPQLGDYPQVIAFAKLFIPRMKVRMPGFAQALLENRV
jgi:hypothetical protein